VALFSWLADYMPHPMIDKTARRAQIQREERADFCIGTDPFHTPAVIRDAVVAAVKETGNSVAIDAPFSGALVPLSCYRKDDRVSSLMIEINRRLYIDEQSGRRNPEFDRISAATERLIITAAEAALSVVAWRRAPSSAACSDRSSRRCSAKASRLRVGSKMQVLRRIAEVWQIDSNRVRWMEASGQEPVGFDWWPGDFCVRVRAHQRPGASEGSDLKVVVQTDFVKDIAVDIDHFEEKAAQASRFATST
jgi:hypothetical protein